MGSSLENKSLELMQECELFMDFFVSSFLPSKKLLMILHFICLKINYITSQTFGPKIITKTEVFEL